MMKKRHTPDTPTNDRNFHTSYVSLHFVHTFNHIKM